VGAHLLSEVLVDAQCSRLLVTLKDVGTVHFLWSHWFPSYSLSEEERADVVQKFKDYSPRTFERVKAHHVVQVHGPTFLPRMLKRDAPDLHKDFVKYFATGHYLAQSRWNFGIPWEIADVDQKLIELIKEKNSRAFAVKNAVRKAKELLSKKKTYANLDAFVENNWHRLDKLLGEEGLQIQMQLREHTQQFAYYIHEWFPAASVEANIENECLDIILPETTPIRPTKKVISADDLLNKEHYIFDIEKPLFRTDDAEVSWLAEITTNNRKITGRRIYTLRNTGLDSIDGFTISTHKDQQGLVAAVTPGMRQAFSVVAYNHVFDVEQTRNAGDLDVDEREDEPKVQVSMDFFRKDIIHGKIILDPLTIARIRFHYLPNRKFELVLAEAQGIQKSKSLNYDQLESLERIARYGDTKQLTRDVEALLATEAGMAKEDVASRTDLQELSAKVAAHYVGKDAENLYNMLFSDWFRESLEDGVWLSETFGVELSRILHSPNTINDAKERLYLEIVGTYRDALYPKNKGMLRRVQKGKEEVRDWWHKELAFKSQPGLHEHVIKAAVPIGLWLADHIAGRNPDNDQLRFPDVDKLVNRFNEHRSNHHRAYMLSQYLDALANDLVADCGLYTMAKQDYEALLKKHNLKADDVERNYERLDREQPPLTDALRNKGIHPAEFGRIYRHFATILQKESEWGYRHLLRGTLTEKGIRDHADDIIADFCARHNTSVTEFKELLKANIAKQPALKRTRPLSQKRFRARLDPCTETFFQRFNIPDEDAVKIIDARSLLKRSEDRLMGQYNAPAGSITETLQERVNGLKDHCAKNGLRIIHAQAGFVYLTGNETAAKNSGLIPVDTLPKAYIAVNPSDQKKRDSDDLEHKIFYKKHKYFEGIKVTDRPSHNFTLFEMALYAPLIEHILDGDYESAFRHADEKLSFLRDTVEDKQAEAEALRKTIGEEHIDAANYGAPLNLPNAHFVWHAKKSNRYRAFEDGRKIQFVTDKKCAVRWEEGKTILPDIKTENGRQYFEWARNGSDKTQKIYVMPMEDLKPDIARFYDHVKNKVADLIRPLTGLENSFAFVNGKKGVTELLS
jgi:hypothetical protein